MIAPGLEVVSKSGGRTPLRGSYAPAARRQRQCTIGARAAMSRLALLLLVATELMRARTATVSGGPSIRTRLERLYEKLERFTVAPQTESLLDKFAAKIDQLNAIAPERDELDELLTDDDEEVLSAMQLWAEMSPEEIAAAAKELQMMRLDADEMKDDEDAFEEGWNDDVSIPVWGRVV